MNRKLFLEDVNFKGKKALVRVDYNVPFDQLGNISDDARVRATLPTINHILDDGGMVVIMSHMGRPDGMAVPSMSLAPVAKRLSRLLNKEVTFVEDCIGPKVQEVIKRMKPGDVVLLENLRFHKGETKNDEEFSKELAKAGDIFVNDAFATAHRSHASTVGITRHMSPSVGGYVMKNEISYFGHAMENPVRPLVAIIGGAKVSSKIGVLKNLSKKVDKIIIGGGMMFTFLKSIGFEVGKSLVEEEILDTAMEILKQTRKDGTKLYLPVDTVVADRMDPKAVSMIVPVQEIPPGWMGLDIGPATTTLFSEVLRDAKSIIWNGPMGVFEIDAFSRGTFAMAHMVANSYAMTIVGGGDTDVAIHRVGESYKISYISTGGGAFLELLEGKELPGLAALTDMKP
ncbi:phosphoglycerate kinase [bacterium]|nr:phosphoglycerate kinase [bacterium]